MLSNLLSRRFSQAQIHLSRQFTVSAKEQTPLTRTTTTERTRGSNFDSLPHILREHTLPNHGNNVALVDGASREEFTYNDVFHTTKALAHVLHTQYGVRRNDRVVYMSRTYPATIPFVYACSHLGAMFTPVNWFLHHEQLDGILNLVQPKLIVTEDCLRPLIDDLKFSSKDETPLLFHDPIHETPNKSLWSIIDDVPDSVLTNDVSIAVAESKNVQPNDTHMLTFTSGTTGLPKGAALPQKGFLASQDGLWFPWDSQLDSYYKHLLMTTPFAIATHMKSLAALRDGTGIVVPRPDIFMDIDHAYDLCHSIGDVQAMIVFASAMNLFVSKPHIFDNFRSIAFGGDAMPVELMRKYVHHVPNANIYQAWGSTEMCGVITLTDGVAAKDCAGSDEALYRLQNHMINSLPDTHECKLINVDAEGVGEIVVRTPCRMTGYWNNPEKTAETIDEDGWLHTGDAAVFNENGTISVVGRFKDIIINENARNIHPVDIEDVVVDHPDVYEAAAIGFPRKLKDIDLGGEKTVVFVASKNHDENGIFDEDYLMKLEEDLFEHCRDHLSVEQIPVRIFILPALPKTGRGVGKIKKDYLRAMSQGEEYIDLVLPYVS